MIFETNSFIPKNTEVIELDDITEAINHFKLFDYILDTYNEEITLDYIIKLHKILKRNTSDEANPKYNVGGFKVLPNIIGLVNVIYTSAPENVESDLQKLLDQYYSLKEITIEDLITFHVRFERIHPLSDGNGRIGRILMFKECLKHNIVPFIIRDVNKAYYLRGLKEFDNDTAYLFDTCLAEQDYYKALCKQLLNIEFES